LEHLFTRSFWNGEDAALAQSHFIYTERVDLPAGRYTLETGVMDQQEETIIAGKRVLLVPASDAKLDISSVVVVRLLKDKDQNTSPMDPWLMGEKVVSPTLEPTSRRQQRGTLTFYLALYLPSWNYSVRFVVKQGSETADETIAFVLEEVVLHRALFR